MTETTAKPLTPQELQRIDAFWRACNYLAVGMIYLRDNPLLKEPLKEAHLKHRLLGHWGASPGLAFMYCHTNRIILAHEQQAIFLAGPGHGGRRASWRRCTWRAPTRRSIPTSLRTQEA